MNYVLWNIAFILIPHLTYNSTKAKKILQKRKKYFSFYEVNLVEFNHKAMCKNKEDR